MIVGDPTTFAALKCLEQIAASGKPLMFWVGAGVGAWCGYPLWPELAARAHEEYIASEPNYDRKAAGALLERRSYPQFFSLVRDTNRERYLTTLKSAFGPKPTVPIYDRFLVALQGFQPLRVVTTNIDENLEKHLPACCTVQRSDLEHAVTLWPGTTPFIVKLHGSVSAIETAVFTSEDYQRLIEDAAYLENLRQLFGSASLVVVGTSLSDEYLLSLLHDGAAAKRLFGDGPHFLVGTGTKPDLPRSFQVIRYDSGSSIGHRTVVHVLEGVAPAPVTAAPACSLASAHFLIDLFPPGAPWTVGTTTQLDTSSGSPIATVVRGLGFTSQEAPEMSTTAHDVLVGLTCFEKIYAPLETVFKFGFLLGGELVTHLIKEAALEFIWWDAEEGIGFPSETAVAGGLSSFVIENPQGKPLTLEEKLATVMDSVRVLPSQVRGFLAIVARATTRVREGMDSPLCTRIQHALRLPNVRHTLGFSTFTPLDVIPRWLAYPVLRTARLSRAADTCRFLKAASIKFPFGAKTLASSLLATGAGAESAVNTANYVLYGSFRPTMPASLQMYRSVVTSLLQFRTTPAAQQLRSAVLQYVASDAGAECAAAIDSALTSAIPTGVMEDSREQFSELLLPGDREVRDAPALWGEASGDPIVRWRTRAKAILLEFCTAQQIGRSDPCPCGSTVSLDKCCLAALEGRQH